MVHWAAERALERQPTYWLVDSASAYLTYRVYYKGMRRILPRMASSSQEWQRQLFEEFFYLTQTQLRNKCRKYVWILLSGALVFDLLVQAQRKKLILHSCLNLPYEDCIYELSDGEKRWLARRLSLNQNVVGLFHFGVMRERQQQYDVGIYAPVAIMSEKRQDEIEESNKEINKRMRQVVKRLAQQQNDASVGSTNN